MPTNKAQIVHELYGEDATYVNPSYIVPVNTQQEFQSYVPTTDQFIPNQAANWDYLTAQVGMNGEPLPAGAEGFDPFGNPYFGTGLINSLKKYAYEFKKDVDQPTAAQWDELAQEWKDFNAQSGGFHLKTKEEMLQPVDQEKQRQQALQGLGLITKSFSSVWQAGEGSDLSLLAIPLKTLRVGTNILFDALQEPAIKTEQALGAYQSMLKYADQQSGMKTIDFKNDTANLAANIFLPGLQIYNSYRFFTAPGTLDEKIRAVKEGWNAGRLLYSSFVKPAVMQEYESRVKAGEDPYLLALELQNPIAEAIGQLVLDPLNLIGVLSKGAKATKVIDEARDITRTSGLAEDAAKTFSAIDEVNDAKKLGALDEFANKVKTFFYNPVEKTAEELADQEKALDAARATLADATKARDEAQAAIAAVPEGKKVAKKLTNALNKAEKAFTAAEEGVKTSTTALETAKGVLKEFKPQSYKVGALNAAGNRTRMSKQMGNQFAWMAANLRAMGRPADDIMEYLGAMVKLSSNDLGEVKDAITTLNHFPSPASHFGEGFLETSAFLRQMVESGGGDVDKLINTFKTAKGDWTEIGKIGRGMMEKAAEFQFPTVSELRRASETVASGQKVTERTLQLAEQFKILEQQRPGLVRLAAIDELASKPKNSVNKILGNFYFSYQYGVAARNRIQNMFQVAKEAGVGAWFEKGKFLSEEAITEKILATHGGVLPPAATGFQTLRKTVKAGSDKLLGVIPSGSALMEKYEISAAKRVYWKKYRQTINNALKPGVALPTLDEFKAAGFSQEQVGKFTRLAQDNYGDLGKTLQDFELIFGQDSVESWRLFESYLPDHVLKGLDDGEIMDEIAELARTPSVTRKQLTQKIEDLKEEVITRAKGIVTDAPGQNLSNKSVESASNLAAEAGTKIKDGVYAKMDVMEEISNQVVTQYKDDLLEAAIKHQKLTGDDTPLKAFYQAFGAEGSKKDELDIMVDGVRRTIMDKQNGILANVKAGANPIDEWSRLPEWFGDPPNNLSKDNIGGFLFEDFGSPGYPSFRASVWETHAQEALDATEAIANQFGMEDVLKGAKKIRQEFEEYRTAVYNPKTSAIYKLPPNASPATRIATIANQYGIPTATKSGVPFEQYVLNVVNKYSDSRYSSMAEIPEDVARAAFAQHTGLNYVEDLAKAGEKVAADKAAREAGKVEQQSLFGYATQQEYEAAQGAKQATEGILYTYEDAQKAALGELKDLPPEVVAQINENTYTFLTNFAKERPESDLGRGINKYLEALKDAVKNMSQESIAEEYAKIEEIGKRRLSPLQYEIKQFVEKDGVRLPPPYPDGATPSMARAMAENSQGWIEALDITKEKMLENFGVMVPSNYTPEMAQAMKGFVKTAGDRMAEARLIAQKVGQYWRDFALLPYGETTHLDHALSYIFPYQFWYSRSYTNWAKSLVTDPQIIAAYAKLKDMMSDLHSDAPEWWRYNVALPDVLGLNNGNPMYINLEAAVWPLYGITGTDFNEPRKRIDWLTSTVDDMGKFGPSIWAPIQIAMAAMLKSKDEDEAARYWGSRLIPQTATVKSIMGLLGKTPVELDPAVQVFSGKGLFDWEAQDPYEERRTGRQLAAMTDEGIPEEVLQDAAYQRSGPLWDEAYTRATALRGPGQISSFLFGVGFKARTPEDLEIDNFYNDMHRLMSLRDADLISPENYTKAWDQMRTEYPFLDVLLLSRKVGEYRDETYVWNVINRIPPGQSREVFEAMGIDPDTADKFYSNKGDMSFMTDTEKTRFMNGIAELGAVLAVPQDATREEWGAAKDAYKNMQRQIEANYGPQIYDRIQLYFEFADRDKAKMYLEMNPDVNDALAMQDYLISNDPLLGQYYGGIDTLERWYNNQLYDELEKRYGKDITDLAAQYSNLKYRMLDSDAAKKFLKEHPELKQYWSDKAAMKDQLNRMLVDFGSKFPEAPQPEFRSDTESLSPQQQTLMQQQPQIPFSEYANLVGPPMTSLILDYYYGEELPEEVTNELDYLAPSYGFEDGQALLIAMLISYVNSGY